ncbi:hypothetical protein [Granulicella arctica]|uniref:hypothetical protein n=1 Tax=Granulicella arctica TaxID=940613 RepID=UPI0021E0D53F|nr:hypothetical protein [Granulicella arctica]
MTERTVVLDKEVPTDQTIERATARAREAEAELARLKAQANETPAPDHNEKHGTATANGSGEAELRKDSMMVHLLDSLADGKDIGHYGRLTFAMVARHFMPHEEVLAWLTRDGDFGEDAAEVMLRQVEGRDYNPPKRDRILEWQAQQDFPIIPNPDDPDCGNLYRNLKFPDEIYNHIEHYQEQKVAAE